MSSTRQLAAIMFTDIVGYTTLMGADEHKAMELVRKNKEVQKPLAGYRDCRNLECIGTLQAEDEMKWMLSR